MSGLSNENPSCLDTCLHLVLMSPCGVCVSDEEATEGGQQGAERSHGTSSTEVGPEG